MATSPDPSAPHPRGAGHTTGVEALLRTLQDTSRCLRELGRTAVAARSVAGLRVLHLLDEHGPARVSGLAEHNHVDVSTMSRCVSALLADGLVARDVDPADARVHVVRLTAEGEGAMRAVRADAVDLIGAALAGWSPEQFAALDASLRRLVGDLEHSPVSDRPRQEGATR